MISRTTAGLLLGISIVVMAAAQLLAKERVGALLGTDAHLGARAILVVGLGDAFLWLAGVLVIASAGCWYLAMSRIPISVMVPVASAISPMVAIGAHVFLGEQLTAPKLAAIALIVAGVAWLALQGH